MVNEKVCRSSSGTAIIFKEGMGSDLKQFK